MVVRIHPRELLRISRIIPTRTRALMARPTRIPSRRLPDSVRRRIEVATAMAWEALVDAHTAQAQDFVQLFAGRLGLEDALVRYLSEMDLDDTMATAVRTRVFVGMEQVDARSQADATLRLHDDQAAVAPRADAAQDDARNGPYGDSDDGWRRFRPDVVMRGVLRRQRESDEHSVLAALALARAEEAIIQTHVDNAISFTALLGGYVGISRAVQHYLGAVILTGSRAHAVFQRTMARLADVHLPL